MTKQEVIKQAYGEFWGIVKDFVNQDGYLWEFEEIGSKNKQMILEFSDIHLLKYSDVGNSPMFYIRPKVLKGIENNNGWIKLNGLPNEIEFDGDIWIINKNGDIEINVNHEYLELGYATHYQPINKPLKPIY